MPRGPLRGALMSTGSTSGRRLHFVGPTVTHALSRGIPENAGAPKAGHWSFSASDMRVDFNSPEFHVGSKEEETSFRQTT